MGEFAFRRAIRVGGVARLAPAADSSEVWAAGSLRDVPPLAVTLRRLRALRPGNPARSLTHARPTSLGPHLHLLVPGRGIKTKNGSPKGKSLQPKGLRKP
jgi:hypothetical protein